VLSHKLSNTLDRSFCIEALNEALCKYGRPEIFNTDQGSQFTSNEFLQVLLKNNIKISMNGKGRATDNAFMERTFRSLKYEEVYLNEYENMFECRRATEGYFRFFNKDRIQQSLDYNTPDDIYYKNHGLLEAS
jgi:putative transposase